MSNEDILKGLFIAIVGGIVVVLVEVYILKPQETASPITADLTLPAAAATVDELVGTQTSVGEIALVSTDTPLPTSTPEPEPTQTALAIQAQGTRIPPSPLPTSTAQLEPNIANTPTPGTLATQQAQLNALNATATAQAIPISNPPNNNGDGFIDSLINLLRDPAFQGLGFIVGLLSLLVAIYQKQSP